MIWGVWQCLAVLLLVACCLKINVVAMLVFDFHCQSCKKTIKCCTDTDPKHEELWDKITSSTGTTNLSCPDCNRYLWHCCECGDQWFKNHPVCLRRKHNPRTVAKEHKCNDDAKRQAKKIRVCGDVTAGDGEDVTPSRFDCSHCDRCTSTRGVDSGLSHQQLWDTIDGMSGTTAEDSVAKVHCPECGESSLQCCHCQYSECLTSKAFEAKCASQHRSGMTIMQRHVRHSHRDKLMAPPAANDCFEGGDCDAFDDSLGVGGCTQDLANF